MSRIPYALCGASPFINVYLSAQNIFTATLTMAAHTPRTLNYLGPHLNAYNHIRFRGLRTHNQSTPLGLAKASPEHDVKDFSVSNECQIYTCFY